MTPIPIEISDQTLEKWQQIVDLLAELVGIPAALIMRLVDADIEVFVSSNSAGNPYHKGDREHLRDSGLYCERVLSTRDRLLVPNALADTEWMHNPDVGLNMISYLGYPILFPDHTPFGTICVLDSRENPYSEAQASLIENFRDLVQSHLELIYMNAMLHDENKRLSDYMHELKVLRGIIPICSYCKGIRDDTGYWSQLEAYFQRHADITFTHGICDACLEKQISDE